jgi:hypothetical protein
LDIDGAYFGTSFAHVFLQNYSELKPNGPPSYVPKIYGFKLFGMRGSKYELHFDHKGSAMNEKDIKEVLKKKGLKGGNK